MHCHAKSAIILFLIKYCFTATSARISVRGDPIWETRPRVQQSWHSHSAPATKSRLNGLFALLLCVFVSMDCGVVGQMFDTEPYENKLFLSAYFVIWEFGLNDSLQLKSKVFIHLAESAKCWLFYQVRGIIQNACFCLFSTDLNKIFHIKYVYM